MKRLKIVLGSVGQDVVVPEKDNSVERKIFAFFRDNPEPEDSKVHEFAKSLGIDEHEFEGMIYKILGSFLGYGKSKGWRGVIDPKQLAVGIKVEMEHTNNPLIAEKIAYDHLAEFSNYYTWLSRMERAAKAAIAKLLNKVKGRG